MSRLMFSFLFLVLAVQPTVASKTTYIQNLPKNGVFNILVLGDSLANGLHQGLTQLNKDRDDLKTTRKSKVNTGLVRLDRYDWNKAATKFARSGKYQVAIILLGLNDMQTIREKGKAHHYKTDGWKLRYIERVENMMRVLKDAKIAVYWVSNPIVSEKYYPEEIFYLNGIYREVAAKNGVRFIDTWTPLATKDGSFTPFYTDNIGKRHEIRHRDGVHFTPDGYQIFAGFVNHILLQDLKSVLPKDESKVPQEELATP